MKRLVRRPGFEPGISSLGERHVRELNGLGLSGFLSYINEFID
jgi:hypothetical protein